MPGASIVVGQQDYVSSGYAASEDGMNFPESVSMDPKGNLWVADYANNRVIEYAAPFANGESASLVIGQPNLASNAPATSQNGLAGPDGLAFDAQGNLWVADYYNNRLLEFQPPFTSDEPASLVVGQSSFDAGKSATTQNGLSSPQDLAFDSKGNLWVADFRNDRVLEFQPPFATNESASLVIGQSGFTAAEPLTAQNHLYFPEDLAFDSKGDLWVADTFNSRVLEYQAPFTNGESAYLVLGQPSFTQNATTILSYLNALNYGLEGTTQQDLYNPGALAFDNRGDLWVADSYNNRIMEFAPPFTSGMPAYRQIGQQDFTTNSPATAQNTVSHPQGMTFDNQGDLWVADTANSRVLEYTAASITSQPASGGGQSSLLLPATLAIFGAVMVATYLVVRQRRRAGTRA
ncbi:MAG TPA: NHL repeat-containing protein [Nitrososphaerales archaeon]|nr:NHL repeat-containing protein [Nitrososphaerales archaeon]